MQVIHVDYWERATELLECDICGFCCRPDQVRKIYGMLITPGAVDETRKVYYDSGYLRLVILPTRVICGACRDIPGPHQFGGQSGNSEYPGPGAGRGEVSQRIAEAGGGR